MASKQRAIYWDTSVFLCFLRKHESERRMETTGPRPLSSDEVEDLQGMFHWPWLKKIALDQRVNRLVAVEAPRMLTYGVTHRPPSKGNFFENLHRARAASAR
jgi:hypothetical protein